MSQCDVSIVIPVYNVAAYLRRCIESVRAQTLSSIEIILATDGPADCDKICEEYEKRDSRIRIVSHPGSYGKGFNRALEMAKGEYIGIVEADDYCSPQMFEKLYTRAKRTDADVARTGFYNSYDFAPPQEIPIGDYPDVFRTMDHPFYLCYQPSIWAGIYRKSFLVDNAITMIEERVKYIDSALHIETAVRANKIALVKEYHYYYYQDNPNQTIKNNDRPADGIISDKTVYLRLKSVFDKNYDLFFGFIFATVCHLMWNYERTVRSRKHEFWELAKNYIAMVTPNRVDLSQFGKEVKLFYDCLCDSGTWSHYEAERKRRGIVIEILLFGFISLYRKTVYAGFADYYVCNVKLFSKQKDSHTSRYRIMNIPVYTRNGK